MQIQFDAVAIEAWAGLSGDRNPIHFDPRAAARMGVTGVVVHGMLALLRVKHAMSREAVGDAMHWVQFKVLLKAPLVSGVPAVLTRTERNGRVGFKLSPEADGLEHMVGNIRRVPAPKWDSESPRFALEAARADAWSKRFGDGLGRGLDRWIGLDAMVFSDFIQNRVGAVFEHLSPALRPPREFDGLESLTTHLVVQTSHQVVFCDALHCTGPVGSGIHYQIDNVDLVESPTEAAGTLDIGVFAGSHHVMTITLGLMVKQQPPH